MTHHDLKPAPKGYIEFAIKHGENRFNTTINYSVDSEVPSLNKAAQVASGWLEKMRSLLEKDTEEKVTVE